MRSPQPVVDSRVSRIQSVLEAARQDLGTEATERISDAVASHIGGHRPSATQRYQRPSLFVRGLRARPWHDPRSFPFIADVEASWEDIRAEALTSLQNNQFQLLVSSGDAHGNRGDWGALHIRFADKWVEWNRSVCPRTFRIVESVPRFAQMAMFSALRAGGHIAPHCGSWNCRLTVHLGLMGLDGCGIRVADEVRTWDRGRCVLFDDSFEHEVWHRGSETRVVLLLDIWHPDLTDAEIELLKRLQGELRPVSAEALVDQLRTGREPFVELPPRSN